MLDTALRHANRKDDHVYHALAQYEESSSQEFLDTHFVHHSFPEMAQKEVSFHTQVANLDLETPFFINAMTGGSPKTKQINRDLALVARETGLAMATGSLSIALKSPETRDSFTIIRDVNPNGVVFANLGAHHSLENAKRALDLLGANALQIHTNTPQELIMPEGERTFVGWLKNIEDMVKHLDVPLIVKEVGFGMSRETIKILSDLGVPVIDVAGRGGTNFAKIENQRRSQTSYQDLYGWGQTTLTSLLEAVSYPKHPALIASGGIKNALDIAKCLAIGASAVGLSGQFLHLIEEQGIEATITYVKDTKKQLETILTLLGARNLKELQKKPLVLAPSLAHWCQARGIDWTHFARR